MEYTRYSQITNGGQNLRLREAVSHKKNIITEFRKDKEIDEVKSRNKSMGQVMQKKIGEVMKKNLTKKPKRKIQRHVDDRCWDLHNKISRLNQTEQTILTPMGNEFLGWEKNGFKNKEALKNLNFSLKMCELSLAHIESDEEIKEEDITHVLKTWEGFQLEPDRTDLNGSKFLFLDEYC